MTAKLYAKGAKAIDRGEKRAVIFGDILEGEIHKGMIVRIPFNSKFAMYCEIENVVHADRIKEEESSIALVLKPDENPDEEAALILDMDIGNEVLEVTSAS